MELWHVLNRGVEKRNVVLDDQDRFRFIHDLFVFNDTSPAQNIAQPRREVFDFSYQREELVRIHAFCLMSNHYHLLLSEKIAGGMPRFLQKLNMGYTKYFNERRGRTGTLWQGKTKKILIENDAHYLYIPYYIHLNPLDYTMPEWREGRVKDVHRALRELEMYRWSSHQDYIGTHNFPAVTHRTVVGELLGSPSHYQKEIAQIIKDSNLATASSLIE